MGEVDRLRAEKRRAEIQAKQIEEAAVRVAQPAAEHLAEILREELRASAAGWRFSVNVHRTRDAVKPRSGQAAIIGFSRTTAPDGRMLSNEMPWTEEAIGNARTAMSRAVVA